MQIGICFLGKWTLLREHVRGQEPSGMSEHLRLLRLGLWPGPVRQVVGDGPGKEGSEGELPDQQRSLAWVLTVDRDPDLCCFDEVCDLRRAWV